MMKLILASMSPRRRELLARTSWAFEVIPSDGEEIHDDSLGMKGLCEENARIKAEAVAKNHPGALVIGADTLVFLDGVPLGKPKDLEDAAMMLRQLSGREHQVCTGVCIAGGADGPKLFSGVTEVMFRELDESVIGEYISLTNPLDKAGAYGIQDHGDMIVSRIKGSFENVMGLPVDLVDEALRGMELPIEQR